MYEEVIVPHNDLYGEDSSDRNEDPRKVIFRNASHHHIVITLIDPKNGTSAEAMIRKDALPAFLTSREI